MKYFFRTIFFGVLFSWSTFAVNQELMLLLQNFQILLTSLAVHLEETLEKRKFKNEVGTPIPIVFTKHDILSEYVQRYNTEHPTDTIDAQNCQAIGGPFTYYNAYPGDWGKTVKNTHPQFNSAQGTDDPHDDFGCGCAWRAAINVLNALQKWLQEKKDIVSHVQKNGITREITMYDIQKWTGLENHTWLEPADNVEIFFKFVADWYSPEDAQKIFSLLQFKGYLLLKNVVSVSDIPKQRNDFIQSRVQDQKARNTLENLRKHFKVDSIEEVLEKLYPLERCYGNTRIPAIIFPSFDEDLQPFPLNIDDTMYARNIYGRHVIDKHIKHIFIGETHIGMVGRYNNPWLDSGWQKIETIFGSKNVMVVAFSLAESA